MIKVANNLQRMIAKQAAANQVFRNESSDPLRPAFAAKGQLPQSYVDDEAMARDVLPAIEGRSMGDRISSVFTPEQWAMTMNTAVGQQNAGLGSNTYRILTPYNYGDTYNMRMSDMSPRS